MLGSFLNFYVLYSGIVTREFISQNMKHLTTCKLTVTLRNKIGSTFMPIMERWNNLWNAMPSSKLRASVDLALIADDDAKIIKNATYFCL